MGGAATGDSARNSGDMMDASGVPAPVVDAVKEVAALVRKEGPLVAEVCAA